MTHADALANLGIRQTASGGEIRVWSENASQIELCLFDHKDPKWVFKTISLTRDENNVWFARTKSLAPGRKYALRVGGPDGPMNSFDPNALLLDPYARGLTRTGPDVWRSVVVDNDFNWNGSVKPNTALDHTVIYEGHVKGLSRLNTRMPEHLRGTYAGLAHETTISYLKKLGVTAVQLLPVHAFVSERRLMKQGLSNYWGYNTLNFFSPHSFYGTREAQANGQNERFDDAVLHGIPPKDERCMRLPDFDD